MTRFEHGDTEAPRKQEWRGRTAFRILDVHSVSMPLVWDLENTMSDKKWIYFFGDGQAEGGEESRHLVGGKGASLAEMTRAHLNVPPGFTISSECCAAYYELGKRWPEGLENAVRGALERLDASAGRPFGVG